MYSIGDLHSYYQSPLGQKTAALLSKDIHPLWPKQSDGTELAVGFPFPFLPHRLMPPVLMPTQPGIAAWQGGNGIMSAEIDPHSWPVANDMLDRVFIAHALEFTPDPIGFLQEAARALCGGGKLVMMVPNRRGLWARSARTPFGHGIPFSRGQLHRLLVECGLQPRAYHRSLPLPPRSLNWPNSYQRTMEKVSGRFAGVLGGVLLVEATKMVYVKGNARSPQRLRKVIRLQENAALRRHNV